MYVKLSRLLCLCVCCASQSKYLQKLWDPQKYVLHCPGNYWICVTAIVCVPFRMFMISSNIKLIFFKVFYSTLPKVCYWPQRVATWLGFQNNVGHKNHRKQKLIQVLHTSDTSVYKRQQQTNKKKGNVMNSFLPLLQNKFPLT